MMLRSHRKLPRTESRDCPWLATGLGLGLGYSSYGSGQIRCDWCMSSLTHRKTKLLQILGIRWVYGREQRGGGEGHALETRMQIHYRHERPKPRISYYHYGAIKLPKP